MCFHCCVLLQLVWLPVLSQQGHNVSFFFSVSVTLSSKKQIFKTPTDAHAG
jgi:hypothetical protein